MINTELFKFNKINENVIQIYGTINGVANLIEDMNRKVYIYNLKFIKNGKLYKISNENIRTLSTLEALAEKIIKIYNECE